MLHYRVEIKQAAVRLVLEEHLTYAEVAAKLAIRKFARSKHGFECIDMYRQEGESSFHELIGRPRKCQSSEQGLERMRVENALVKKIPHRIAERSTRETKYRASRHNRQEYPVKAMCEFFGVSRTVYYVWVKQLEQPNPHAEHKQLT